MNFNFFLSPEANQIIIKKANYPLFLIDIKASQLVLHVDLHLGLK